MRARDQSSIFSTGGKFRPDYGLLLELHVLTLVARSYALLYVYIELWSSSGRSSKHVFPVMWCHTNKTQELKVATLAATSHGLSHYHKLTHSRKSTHRHSSDRHSIRQALTHHAHTVVDRQQEVMTDGRCAKWFRVHTHQT